MTELLVAMRELLERCLFRLSADPDNLIDEDRLCEDIRLALTVPPSALLGAVVMTELDPQPAVSGEIKIWVCGYPLRVDYRHEHHSDSPQQAARHTEGGNGRQGSQ